MKNLLLKISEKGEAVDPNVQVEPGAWLGTSPATAEEIQAAEIRLGVKLPEDYTRFLQITNGFIAPNDIEPTFEKVGNIDYLRDTLPYIVEIWTIYPEFQHAIIVAGIHEEQQFFLIPPTGPSGTWRYWAFAAWVPGADEYSGLEAYFEKVLDFLEGGV